MEDIVLWRYMDFTKYVDLISTGHLFFSRSDCVGDDFEGSYPEKYANRKIKEIRNRSESPSSEISQEVIDAIEHRKRAFMNCWHASAYESAALWKLYMKSDEGIAIRTTRNRLKESLINCGKPAWTVPIIYIDYLQDDPPIPTRMAPFRYKRKSFEHEKEIRAIFFEDEISSKDEGVGLKADLSILIESVHVSPTAPAWNHGLVSRVSERYGVSAPVLRSSLSAETPFFI